MASIDFSKYLDDKTQETPDVQIEKEPSFHFEQFAVQDGDKPKTDFSKYAKQTSTSEAAVISQTKDLTEQTDVTSDITPIERAKFTGINEVTRGYALDTRRKVIAFAGKMVDYIPPDARKAIGNFFKRSFDKYDPNTQDKQLSLTSFLSTPTGEYLSRLGAALDPIYLTEKAGIPDKFDIPDITKLPYGAMSILNAAGSNMDDVQDRIGLAIGIDFLSGLGFDNLLFPMKDAKKASKIVNEILSMPEDVREQYFDNLLDLLDKGELKPDSLRTLETPMEPKQISLFGEKAVDPVLSSNTLGDGYNVIDGMLVKMNPDGTSTAIKKATSKEVLNALLKNNLERERFINNLDNILNSPDMEPIAGRWDVMDVQNPHDTGNILTGLRTPVYYAPNVDMLVGDMRAMEASLFEDFWGTLKGAEKFEGKDISRLMFEVADKGEAAEEALNVVKNHPEAMRAVREWERVADNIADILKIPVENRKTEYMHHWFKDIQHKDFSTPEELRLWIKKNEGPLKYRKGVKGYETDFVSVARKYVRWAARKASTDKFKSSIFEEVTKLKELDASKGRMAELAVYNYFGELSKAGGFPAWNNSLRNLKSTFVQGTLGFNIRAAWRNLSQTWTLGMQEIGLPAVIEGHKRTFEMMRGTKKGKEYLDIMRRSGLLTNTSEDLLETSLGLWGGAFAKVFGKKAGVKLVEAATSFQQMSETFNKSVINLGRRAQIETKMKLVKAAPGKYRKLERWLLDRGINPAEDIETAIRRGARQSTIKTQFDYSRWGQNLLTMNPIASPALVYMNWPIRGNEYLMHNGRATMKYLWKAMKNPRLAPAMLRLPETQATMIFGVQHAFNLALKATTGLSISAVLGAPLYMIKESPILKAAEQTWNVADKVSKGDTTAVRDLMRSAGTMSGFVFNSPAWMIADIIRVARENRDRPGDKWSVTNPVTKKHMYWVNPMAFVLDSLNSGIQTVSKEEYYESRKQAAADFLKKKGLRDKLEKAMELHDTQKAREIKNQLREEKRKQKRRAKLQKRNQKKSERGFSADGQFF